MRPRAAVLRWGAAAALAGATALLAHADRADAAVGPQGVRDGHNITVFHNIDFVAAFGHGTNDTVRVDVVRGGHRIATARGLVTQLGPPEGGALEVNHGVEGTPLPGDCWEGGTPDVQPGDLIRVSSNGGVDEVIVDDVTIDTVRRVAGPNGTVGDDDDEVWVEGNARSGADGEPIPAAELDSGEFRDPDNGGLRLTPNVVVAGATRGTYIAKYGAPFQFVKDPVPAATALAALQRPDGHAFGFGHTAVLPQQSMLVEGAGLHNGPAAGCEALAPASASSAGATSTAALNAAHLGGLDTDAIALTVGGWAAGGLADAEVELRDSSGGSVLSPVTGLNASASGQQGWTAEFSKADIAGLAEGSLTAQLRVGGSATGAAMTVRFDTGIPAPPTASPGAGTYAGAQLVDLGVEPGATVHYTVDGGAPTTASPRYRGGLLVDRDMTIRAIAVDAAGNVSPVATLAFTIRAPAVPGGAAQLPLPGLQVLGATASPAGGAAQPGVTLRVSRVSAPARLSARGAGRNGLVASFVAPAGAEYAEARLYRVAGGRRALIGKRVLATESGRREFARFTSAAVRRKLKPGRYVLEVRTGPALDRLGPAVVQSLRVSR